MTERVFTYEQVDQLAAWHEERAALLEARGEPGDDLSAEWHKRAALIVKTLDGDGR